MPVWDITSNCVQPLHSPIHPSVGGWVGTPGIANGTAIAANDWYKIQLLLYLYRLLIVVYGSYILYHKSSLCVLSTNEFFTPLTLTHFSWYHTARFIRCTIQGASYTVPNSALHTLYHTARFIHCTIQRASYTVPNSALHTLYHTARSIRCTTQRASYLVPYSALHTLYHTARFIRCTAHALYRTARFIRCTAQRTVYAVPHSALHTLYRTARFIHCTPQRASYAVPYSALHKLYHTAHFAYCTQSPNCDSSGNCIVYCIIHETVPPLSLKS
jgi:hypothetical protein